MGNYTPEEMIEVMQQTAKENGGKPLGYTTLQNETGIGPYDWNKYWDKYGDFVIDAGLTPNKAYTKHPEGFLEEKIVSLIRKLGKYPTINQMRVERTNNPDFPHTAIKKIKKMDFVRNLSSYCEKKSGYDDILEICKPMLEKYNEKEKENEEVVSNSNKIEGSVYLYKRGKDYKIGHSNDPVRRGKEIRLETPETLKLIHEFKTDDPSGVETYWKKRFKEKRKGKTEFFSLNFQDIKAFKRWKKIF